MPALAATRITGRVHWLGTVADRDAALASAASDSLRLTFAGPEGEAHGGVTRPACSRVSALYTRDTPIRNARQLSIVAREELDLIAKRLDLDHLDPAWLGATMVVEGIPDFSHLPPSSRLQFGGTGEATVVIDMQNRPCTLPIPVIEAARPGHGARFKAVAKGLRGVTAAVEREGAVRLGSEIRVFVPDQRAWRGAESLI